jgi:hypothetical protein
VSRPRSTRTWAGSTFASPAEASAWYQRYTEDPAAYDYAAYYDKTDPAIWPGPVEETVGTAEVTTATLTAPDPDAGDSSPGFPIPVPLVIGGLVVAGLAIAAAASSRGSGGPA